MRIALRLTAAMLLGLAGAAGAATAADASPRAGRSAVQATQQLAQLNHTKQTYSRPNLHSQPLELVSSTRPITGEQTVLPVMSQTTDRHGSAWFRVLLPGRPNSHTGWISARGTTLATTKWRITVHLSARQVDVFWDGRLDRTFTAVVGKPSTPTPQGHFFVEEAIALGPQGIGAPYALALSARSDVLQQFDGGPGQIALHGIGNVGGILGTAESHGCIRLDTASISWLAARIAPGTTVTILG